MIKKKNGLSTERFGGWAFIIGVILAVLLAFLPNPLLVVVLILLGLLVGVLNVTAEESTKFLVATIALLVAGAAGLSALPSVGSIISSILKNIVAFVAPAALIVSLKAVYELAAKK